jgi:DNA-binding CsgD family transcriptional regulator
MVSEPTGSAAARSRKNRYPEALITLGMSALWICLQSSGFYPLSLVPDVWSVQPDLVARLHLAYCCTVILLACAITPAVSFLERSLLPGEQGKKSKKAANAILKQRRGSLELHGSRQRCIMTALSIAVVVLGVIGHALLLTADPLSSGFVVRAAIASVIVGAFVTLAVFGWAVIMSAEPADRACLLTALSFLFAQAIQIAYYVFASSAAALFIVAPVACAAGLFGMRDVVAERTERKEGESKAQLAGDNAVLTAPEGSEGQRSLSRLPWRILLTALFVVYFIVVFVRLCTSEFSGDAPFESKVVSSVVAFVVMTLGLIVLKREGFGNRSIIGLFTLFAVTAIVSMALILVLDPLRFVFRPLIGIEHCIEAYIWMLLVASVSGRSAGRVVLMFCRYLIAVVAVVWAISFDLFYLSPLSEISPGMSVLVPGLAIALAVVSSGVIWCLFSQLKSFDRVIPSDYDDVLAAAVESVTSAAGVTPSERSVAVMLCRGYSAKRIADELSLSESTVKTYASRIYHKLGISSKQELISLVESSIEK